MRSTPRKASARGAESAPTRRHVLGGIAACGTVGALTAPAFGADVSADEAVDDTMWLRRRLEEGVRTGLPVVLPAGIYTLRSDVAVSLSKGARLSVRGQTGSAEDVLLDLLPARREGQVSWPRLKVRGVEDSAFDLQHLTIRGSNIPRGWVGERGLNVEDCGVVTLQNCLFLDHEGLTPMAIPGVVRFSSATRGARRAVPLPRKVSPSWP